MDLEQFIPLLPNGKVMKTGMMIKTGTSIFARKSSREFELIAVLEAPFAPAVLSYRKAGESREKPRGIIKLADCTMFSNGETDLVITPHGSENLFYELFTNSSEERDAWREAVVQACKGGIKKVQEKKKEMAKKEEPAEETMMILMEGEMLMKTKGAKHPRTAGDWSVALRAP